MRLFTAAWSGSTVLGASASMRDWTGAPWWYLPALVLLGLVIVGLYGLTVYRDARRENDDSTRRDSERGENRPSDD